MKIVRCSFLNLQISKIEFIIIKFIVKRPLKPSIKLAPLTINKKHQIQKILKIILFSNNLKR